MVNAKEILSKKKLLYSCLPWDTYEIPEYKMIYYVAKPESEKLTVAQHREETEALTKAIESTRCTYLMSDARKFMFPIPPESQEWILKYHAPRWNAAGLKKFGLVLIEDFIAQLGAEQTIDEMQKEGQYTSRFFASEQEALVWLLT